MSNNLKLNSISSSYRFHLGLLFMLLAAMMSSQTADAAANESSSASASSTVSSPSIQSPQDATNKKLPAQVYVTSVDIGNKRTYAQGDAITGTFTLYNYSDFDVSGISYEIRLVGGLEDNSIRTYDETKGSSPVNLKSKEKKEIPFTYVLSKKFSGSGVGIFIQSTGSDGFDLGWKTSDSFSVAGESSYLNVLYSSVEVSGIEATSSSDLAPSPSGDSKFYPTQAGAFIYQNKYPQKAFVQFILENKNKTAVTVTPSVSISELRDPSTVLYRADFKDHVVSVEADKNSNSTALDLPNFNWTPGIYKGTVSFKNAQGEDQADKIEFLYIVGGEQLSVRSLSSGAAGTEKDGVVSLSMGYDGTPVDVHSNDGEQSRVHLAAVTTTLFNERDEKIGENIETVDFIGEQTRDFSIQASGEANAMRAEVSISKDNSIIKKYDFKLSPDYDAVRDAYKNDHKKMLMYVAACATAMVAIAILVMSVIYKRRFAYRRK